MNSLVTALPGLVPIFVSAGGVNALAGVLFWFDNDFVIESKYHRKIVVLFLKARILSLQDVVFRSMFFLIFY